MPDDIQGLLRLIGQSFSDPSTAAHTLYARRYDRGTLWSLMVLVTALSVVMLGISNTITGVPEELKDVALQITPFAYALILGSTLVLLVFGVYFIGQIFGGKGHFPETLMCIIWLQVLSLALQVVQLVAILIAPPLVGVVSLIGLGLVLYSLGHFINVLHGFDSLLKSFGTFALAIFGMAFGFAMILAMVGVATPGVV